ncbi:amidohydrolase family protein [Hymenobacter sp. DH14]|uniref:Amidohydrolase family protein n=1 Tax=Hymenobacter cyanobacteriorum TaxID=2926463 RepID=A0A9X2AFP5_9BACT|nr:amidohydrolase family protein [Hymenobacter cyanobacteriorum]MCI1186758.1 amidohydrolase family protein [Hymenobacter cyanobacteriorum]
MLQKALLPALFAALAPALAQAQVPAPTDSATFLLHKFEQRIGQETYHLTRTAQAHTYDVNFRFVDRSSPVALRANIAVTPAGEPLRLAVKGQTSRFSTINDTITISNGQARIRVDDAVRTEKRAGLSFPVAGYSPGTGQLLLLRYWQQHGRPASLALLPGGTVHIREDGRDTVQFQNRPLVLRRYVLKGLVWGNELLWTDQQNNLLCIITNDAEGDKLEMMWQPYESLLPALIGKAAGHGMRLFRQEIGAAAKPGAKPQLLAIAGGTVVDVVQGRTIPNAVVVLEGGKILKVGPASSTPIPKGARVIRAEGKTVLPGLWDMHAHFQQAEWGPAYLAAGVTTVRDCGNEFSYINAIQQAIDGGRGVGPRILKAGLIDGEGPAALGIVRASTPAEAAAVVQRYKANGFAQIKLYSSVKPEMVPVICAEAHRVGLPVTGHIPEGMTITQGVNAGMDQVNHISYVVRALRRNPDRSLILDDTASTRVFNFLKAHHTVIDPTVGVYELMFRSTKDDITAIEPAYARLPQSLQALFRTMGTEPDNAAKYAPYFASFARLVKALYDHGIPVVAGTDMGFPGTSLARELELYVQGGLTPMQALQTATIAPARAMQAEARAGSLDAGKQADVLIIDGNPLQQIRDLRRVQLVVKNGQVYEPAQMRKLADYQQ